MRRTNRKKWTNGKLLRLAILAAIGMGSLAALFFVSAYLYLSPKLPDIGSLKETKFSIPLRIYTSDNKLLGEYGEKKRTPVSYDKLPKNFVNAFVAAEDSRFFDHGGVDYWGLARAVLHLIKTGRKGQGGSTITMQVARNFFLSREKTYLRKLNEIFLAWKIEDKLSKGKIIELYLNKIYLGNRAYGIAAAGEVYYGKAIDQLTLAQMAMIAGLPKAPSRYNPIVNPRRALLRRAYVLRRMLELNLIDKNAYRKANEALDEASVYAKRFDINAPYLAEMVRNKLVRQYGTDVYNSGFKVFTSIDSRLQKAANAAMRKTLMDYDHRHGYRGPQGHFYIDKTSISDTIDDETFSQLDAALDNYNPVGHLQPALVVAINTETDEEGAKLYGSATVFQSKYAEYQTLPWKGLSWAKPFVDRNRVGDTPTSVARILTPGDIIYIEKINSKQGSYWRLAQIPEVEGALVSLDPSDGKILALVGGFDFEQAKFNHVTQAKRQPGSNFKPYIYSAALEKCFTPATIINDAPIVIQDSEGNPWRPQNDNGKFRGPLRLRTALTKSVNLVSIRILRDIGVPYAIEYAKRFGIGPGSLPRNLTLALGTASVTPLSMVRGYATFANGGYLIDPYFIEEIQESNGDPVYQAPTVVLEETLPKANTSPYERFTAAQRGHLQPAANTPHTPTNETTGQPHDTTSEEEEPNERIAKRVISENNAFLMTSIMRDVIKLGTGRRARQLNRQDLAGKTGTTNDQVDAWFSGFNYKVATSVWVGFDQPNPLGRGEYGGRAALPMWISYMREALKGIPEKPLVQPAGISTMRIDPTTGEPAPPNTPGSIFEYFASECLPETKSNDDEPVESIGPNDPAATDELF